MKQQTIKKTRTIEGVGLHSAKKSKLILKPAPENHGIVFTRTDLETPVTIPALAKYAQETPLCTTICKDGVSISTIEHLMAAISALNIDNLNIEIDSPEVPILDGSSKEFVRIIEKCQIVKQRQKKKLIRILKSITIKHGQKSVSLEPSETSDFSFEIDFKNKIGKQDYQTSINADTFKDNISSARTFGFADDVDKLKKQGLAKGGTYDNAVVLSDDGSVLNKGGLRFSDELVRHKLLDAIGDTFLSGLKIIGHYKGVQSSHAMNVRLIKKLYKTKGAFAIVES